MTGTPAIFALLRLTLTPGLGPVLIERLITRCGSAEAAVEASAAQLQSIQGIGPAKAAAFVKSLRESEGAANAELALADRLGVRLIDRTNPEYPALLAEVPSSPPLLYFRGTLAPLDLDRFPVGIVGSRECSHYGLEQANRFAGVLARAGLTVVSGGARGIDTAAHRGALTNGGRTLAVLGCGLAHCYPPENTELYDKIAAQGAVISELPLNTSPHADNFPARNRIISGLSLGILVVEAGARSGALITARLAAEDHGREVMALPGRVDSPSSRGTLELIKSGGAALVTDPGDVIQLLESPAHHQHRGTHAARYGQPDALFHDDFGEPHTEPKPMAGLALPPAQQSIIDALEEPRTLDQLMTATGLDPAKLRTEITLLELQRRVMREGSLLRRNR